MSTPLIIIFALLATAFFAGMEIAFISANKFRMEVKGSRGHFTARVLSSFLKSPARFIGATLIGNNVALVIYGIFMAKALDTPLRNIFTQIEHYPFLLFAVKVVIASAIILFFGEFLPKVLFRLGADTLVYIFAFPMMAFYYLTYPLVHFIIWMSRTLLRVIFDVHYRRHEPIFKKADLLLYIKETLMGGGGKFSADIDTEYFSSALELDKIKVRECMVPRTEIEAIDQNASVEEMKKRFMETGYSRLIVYNKTIDNVTGYIHTKDIFQNPQSISEIFQPILVVPESMPGNVLLRQFTENARTIALAVDEFGGTAGIVTIEDVMEEIFGEIRDEHDEPVIIEKKLEEGKFLFSARIEIDYLNEKYGLNIPAGEYETLGGYIVSRLERIPRKGEQFLIDKFSFTVQESTGNKLDLIKAEAQKT